MEAMISEKELLTICGCLIWLTLMTLICSLRTRKKIANGSWSKPNVQKAWNIQAQYLTILLLYTRATCICSEVTTCMQTKAASFTCWTCTLAPGASLKLEETSNHLQETSTQVSLVVITCTSLAVSKGEYAWTRSWLITSRISNGVYQL